MPNQRLKIAVITTDNREHDKRYELPMPYFGTAPEALLQGFAGIPEVEVHVVSNTQRAMASPAKLADNIWFHSLHVPNIGWMRTVYQGCIRAVRRKLREIAPDIVHGQGTERDCGISTVFSGFPNVLTIHGNMRLIAQVNHARPFSFLWLAARLEKMTLPRTRGIVCITNYTRQAVEDLAKRTWVVPNAVDASFFNVAPASEGSRTILCVGNICLRKNQNAFIRALDSDAQRQRYDVKFLGGLSKADPYGKEFLELIASRPWCRYEGFASREVLKTQLKTAAMVALPSLEDNCPMVVLESMAAGIPVLAAKVGGVPDLIDDGRTGFFCDPLNASSMMDGVCRIMENPAESQKMTVRAKQEAQKRFHPLAIAQRHVEIYREVLSTNS